MNVHHLELFYYVARHGGISQAVRNMPYGIQQPAMSGQIIHLEEFLGVTLLQRRPFQLTAAGEDLYRFIGPFFFNINSPADRLRGGVSQQIRVGASQLVLRNYSRCKPASVNCLSSLRLHPSGVRRSEGERS